MKLLPLSNDCKTIGSVQRALLSFCYIFTILVYSEVFKARCKKTKKLVALKKVLMENEKEGVSLLSLFVCFICSEWHYAFLLECLQ